jgi:hypothetical protein
MRHQDNLRLSTCLGTCGEHGSLCRLRALRLGPAAIGGGFDSSAGPLSPDDLSRRIAELAPAILDVFCRMKRGLPCEYREPTPQYNRDSRRLTIGRLLVHRFAPQAKNVIEVVTAFEDLSWPPAIHDPLGNQVDPGFAKRQHDTVRTLNRLQKPLRIRFSATSHDRMIRWEFVDGSRRRRRQSPRA